MDRTIYITGIPANCTKSVLSQSIRTALNAVAEGGESVGIDRILLAQPIWSTKTTIPSFDRLILVVFFVNLIECLELGGSS